MKQIITSFANMIFIIIIFALLTYCSSVRSEFDKGFLSKNKYYLQGMLEKYKAEAQKDKDVRILYAKTQMLYDSILVEEEWQNILHKNDQKSYKRFVEQYPDNIHSSEAKDSITSLSFYKDFMEAKVSNSEAEFEKILEKYKHIQRYEVLVKNELERINREIVDNILNNNPGLLPSPVKDDYKLCDKKYTVIEILDSTEYDLIIRFIGKENKKIVLKPKERKKFKFKNGDYKVTATVNRSHVKDFAGEYECDGCDYSVKFYISYEWSSYDNQNIDDILRNNTMNNNFLQNPNLIKIDPNLINIDPSILRRLRK